MDWHQGDLISAWTLHPWAYGKSDKSTNLLPALQNYLMALIQDSIAEMSYYPASYETWTTWRWPATHELEHRGPIVRRLFEVLRYCSLTRTDFHRSHVSKMALHIQVHF